MIRLNQKQLEEKVKFVKSYREVSVPADGSPMDANANVTSKNIATLAAEMHKDANIQIKRKMTGEIISDLYGPEMEQEFLRQLEAHEIYFHDETSAPGQPYCASINMYPFLLEGLKGMGGESGAPKHISSFCGNFINLIYAISANFAGAIGAPEMLFYFDHFARKDYGKDYLKTHEKEIKQHLQEIIYSLNQPAAARGFQAVFFNLSVFDEHYFKSIFGDFVFPDGGVPDWNSLKKLQVFFLDWFNQERQKALLTFPVITAAILHEDGEPSDPEFVSDLADQLSKGNSFFMYLSDSPDSLSSCCFGRDDYALCRMPGEDSPIILDTFRNIWNDRVTTFRELPDGDVSVNMFRVYREGEWHDAKMVRVPIQNKKMYQVLLENGQFLHMTEDHKNLVVNKETLKPYLVETRYLTPEIEDLLVDYQVGIPETLADSSEDQIESAVALADMIMNFDLEYGKDPVLDSYLLNDPDAPGAQPVLDISGILGLGTGFTGALLASVFNHPSYRERIKDHDLSGLYAALTTIRTLVSTPDEVSDALRAGIKWVKEVSSESFGQYAYCFQVIANDPDVSIPYFTLPSGVITHNCRLRNEIDRDKIAFSYSLGAGGVSTGSINVITMNMNRLIQDTFGKWEGQGLVGAHGFSNEILETLQEAVRDQVKKIHCYQMGYRKLVEQNIEAGLLPVYDRGFISLEKQYMTVGVNGLLEAAEYLGIDPSPSQEYFQFVNTVLEVIYHENRGFAEQNGGILVNTEMVPAESLGVKNAMWDKKDGYFVPRDCYNSYFFRQEDESCTIVDKFRLHGEDYTRYLDGGSALHLNLQEYPDQEQYKKLIRLAIRTGCNYFCTNIMVSVCESCGHIDKDTHATCPRCGSADISLATRVIGYLKKIRNFSETRRQEASRRIYHHSDAA